MSAAADWRWLIGTLRSNEVRYPDRVQRLMPELEARLAELERPRVVFRPAGRRAWWLGYEHRPQRCVGAPEALAVLHRAVGGACIPATRIVRKAAAWPANAAREQLRSATRWVQSRVSCPPLIIVLRAVGVRGGLITYVEPTPSPVVLL